MGLGRWPVFEPRIWSQGHGARTQRKQETDRSGGPCAPRAACSVKLGLALGELGEMVGFLLPESMPQKAQKAQKADGRRTTAAAGTKKPPGAGPPAARRAARRAGFRPSLSPDHATTSGRILVVACSAPSRAVARTLTAWPAGTATVAR